MREAFEQWWSHYPKRPNNPKQPAWEVWQRFEKAGTLPPLAEMIAAAERYGDLMKRERVEPKFIAHARTWLHQRRFEEFIVVDGAPTGSKKAQEKPALPAILSPVFDRVGAHWWNERFHECEFEDDGEFLLIRTPHRFFMSRVELAAETVGRMIPRFVKVEALGAQR